VNIDSIKRTVSATMQYTGLDINDTSDVSIGGFPLNLTPIGTVDYKAEINWTNTTMFVGGLNSGISIDSSVGDARARFTLGASRVKYNTMVPSTTTKIVNANGKIQVDITYTYLGKADVGLGNVSNLAPVDLPLSTASQTALDAKLNATSFNDTATTSKILTGYSINSTRVPIVATDTILQGFNKSQKYFNDLASLAFSGNAQDINAGTLGLVRGGTGVSSLPGLKDLLGIPVISGGNATITFLQATPTATPSVEIITAPWKWIGDEVTLDFNIRLTTSPGSLTKTEWDISNIPLPTLFPNQTGTPSTDRPRASGTLTGANSSGAHGLQISCGLYGKGGASENAIKLVLVHGSLSVLEYVGRIVYRSIR
jgi:hypothetical protein